MNLKGLGIGLALILGISACAGMASCAVVTTPVMTRAVSAEYDTYDVSLDNENYRFDDYDAVVEYSSLQSGFGLTAGKTYVIGGIRVGYGYSFDAEDYSSVSYWIRSFSPLVYVYDFAPVNMTFPSSYCCWYAGGVSSGYWHVFTAGSKNDNNVNVVPYTYYLNMIDGESLDASSVLDYGYMDLSYRAPDAMRLSNSLFAWCESTYMYLVRNCLSGLVAREVANKVGVYADYANDVRIEYGQERYQDGLNRGFTEGQSSVTNESTAINTLFGSIWNVPMSLLNGLMPLAIWGTPLVSILISLVLIGVLIFFVKRLVS